MTRASVSAAVSRIAARRSWAARVGTEVADIRLPGRAANVTWAHLPRKAASFGHTPGVLDIVSQKRHLTPCFWRYRGGQDSHSELVGASRRDLRRGEFFE